MENLPTVDLMLISIFMVLVVAVCVVIAGYVVLSRLRQSLRGTHQQLTALSSQVERIGTLKVNTDDLKAIKNDLARLNFAPGNSMEPSEIITTASDSYENLDQNWGSIHDTAGREARPPSGPDRSRTAVIVILGQSNAANHGSGSYVAKRAVSNFNLYDSKCYHAADPLLGASGDGGNFATRLGDKLIKAGLFDRIVLAPIAMGGTTVEQWAEEGMFNRRIVVLIKRLYDAGLGIDFILWQQGEGNPGMGDVGGRQYRKNLWEVVRTFRRYSVNAPFFVSLTTLCGGPHANAENIRAGQKSAVDHRLGVYLGPDTDTIGVELRWDKCHFDQTGLDLAASLWSDVIGAFYSERCVRDRPSMPLPDIRPTNGEVAAATPRFSQNAILSQLAAALAVEASRRPVDGQIIVANERLGRAALTLAQVNSCLSGAELRPCDLSTIKPADMIVAWECLNNAFHPRAMLDELCTRLRPRGRLIYAQRIIGIDYLSLTPKWLLDYFIAAGYSDCRVYLFWSSETAPPAVATFDYAWMLDHAEPKYSPIWDNITHADAVLVVAEKGEKNQVKVPSQDNYRSSDEWEWYATALRHLERSKRPWHVTGPVPARLPEGYKALVVN